MRCSRSMRAIAAAMALLPDTVELSIRGHVVRLVSLEKIVELKRASTRPKDLQNLPVLEATLRRR